MRARLGPLCFLTVVGCHSPTPAVRLDGSAERPVVVVSPLPADVEKALSSGADWSEVFGLHVVEGGEVGARPMLGEAIVRGDVLTFTPRFPLSPGLTYRAVLRGLPPDEHPELELTLPERKLEKTTVVTAVYPTADALPENLLKLYVCFSAPMSRGMAYEHVALLDAGGREMGGVFLPLGEELWDRDTTRLTLLLDPGRVKQGLRPREDLGPALVTGRTYTLVIGADWPDARGAPLAEGFAKRFTTLPADDRMPDPARWSLELPRAGTRQALLVRFHEMLDHALVQRLLWIQDPSGRAVEGEVVVDQHETRWQLHPARPWSPGDHELIAGTALEDLAGNNLERPFEVDVFDRVNERLATDALRRAFRIE